MSKDVNIENHNKEISCILDTYLSVVEQAQKHGIRMTIDVAIEPEDFGNSYGSFGFTPPLILKMGTKNIGVEITAYRP